VIFSNRERASQSACVGLLALVAALAYWPSLRGFWVRDDFALLAYMRLVGAPWAFFVDDHFMVPGAIFRPLGFASMWLTQALFGLDYRAESLADLGLHIAVAVALFRVNNLLLPRGLAWLCALTFAVHPAAMATVQVWSNRFDLLAALFCLLSLRAAYDWRRDGRAAMLAVTLLFALAAMASKEVGVAVLIPIFLLWLDAAVRDPRRAKCWQALAALFATAALYLAWRWIVLGTPSSHLTGSGSLPELMRRGILNELVYAPGYLSFWPRLDSWQRTGTASAALMFVVVAAFALRRNHTAPWKNRRRELLVSGLGLWLVPLLLQAPVAALNAAPLTASASAIEVAMQSRLYYLSTIGAVIFFAVLLSAMLDNPEAAQSRRRPAATLLLVVLIASLGSAGRRTTTDYGLRSSEMSQLARAAVASVAAIDIPKQRCHVYFLDFQPPPESSIYVSMDSVVKALEPDLKRVQDCLFHNEYPTYFYFVPHGRVDALAALPFRPLEANGAAVPWLHVGRLDIVYLSAPREVDRVNADGGKFLAYKNGRFLDVTAEITDGRREVDLQ